MKNLFFSLVLLIASLSLKAQTPIFTDTKGELSITNSGQASYNLPIALPPSLKNVAPVINLTYSSGQRGGIAGQGWSINSISSIARTATRVDIDGFRDGVDFDDNDKLSLDGQRLLLKTGVYWQNNSTYETEYKSNTRIELKIENALGFGLQTYFIVTSPDGSQTWYGSTGAGVFQNATSVNAWFIVRFVDTFGNFITYNYTQFSYNNTAQTYIDNIKFSGNEGQGLAQINEIKFNYRTGNAARVEVDYMKGQAVYAFKILENIQVLTGGLPFRKYKLTQVADDSGYERVSQVQEFNGANEPSNPAVFGYGVSPTETCQDLISAFPTPTFANRNLCPITRNYNTSLNFSAISLSGDFDGDGQIDFVANNQLYTGLLNGGGGNNPIGLPFVINNIFKNDFVVSTQDLNNKLNQNQSILKINTSVSGFSFNIFNLVGNQVINNLTKDIYLDNTLTITETTNPPIIIDDPDDTACIFASNCGGDYSNLENSKFLTGDFNGDGITEVIISHSGERELKIINGEIQTYQGHSCISCGQSYDFKIKHYMLDLSNNASTNIGTKGFHLLNGYNFDSLIFNYNGAGNETTVQDFNGDGKSDIIVFSGSNYRIITFKQLNQAPWTEIEIIAEGNIPNNTSKKIALYGDYNGDGKVDIMIPSSDNSTVWVIYYANPNPNGGEFFTAYNFQSIIYKPYNTSSSGTWRDYNQYHAMDINKDGKTDLVNIFMTEFKYTGPYGLDPSNWDSKWRVTGYTNNIGKGSENFTLTNQSPLGWSDNPGIPMPLVTNYRYQGQNTDLVIINNFDNNVKYYKFNRDSNLENRLITVSESNGNIVQTINYAPMMAANEDLGTTTDFYSSTNAATYPNLEIIKNRNNMLVSKLSATINGVSKFQDFKYRSMISNFEYGTIGFARTARSSWYTASLTDKIWTVQEIDPNKRGASTNTWSTINGANVFATVPSDLLSSKTNEFETYTNPTSKQYNVLLNKQTTTDHSTNVKNETIYSYDGLIDSATAFGLQTKTVNNTYLGTVLQGTSTIDTSFENNAAGVGNAYFIGKPKTVESNKTIYPNDAAKTDTRTSKELYTYTGVNLTKIEKRGHNTTNQVFEDMTYDLFGNLLTKTVSCPGARPTLASRTITDEYDTASKRFVVKKTDHQGFVSTLQYNNLGQVSQSIKYLGVENATNLSTTSNFVFDTWGKLTTNTTIGGSTTALTSTTAYAKMTHGGYTTTNTNNVVGATTITEYSILGTVIKNINKGFTAGATISKSISYDALGRKTREYEPYFITPGKYVKYEYDNLSRPKKVTAPTGRIQTISYNGLTTTSVDDTKTTSATSDALGNKVTTTDDGGTINFNYYANGQLKESDYGGHKIKVTIDGWGNKTSMTDPNAGIYSYTTDEFGQAKTETTPKGLTTYAYDNVGKLITKTILGDGADYVTTYAYNSFAQLISETSKKANNVAIDSFVYRYDSLKRLDKTTETNPAFTHSKTITFDTYSRPATETTLTTDTASGMSATVVAKSNYNTYNGIMDKMTDANNAVLWQLNTANEKMQALTATLGNGVVVTNTYDADNYFSSQKHSKGTINILDNTYSFDPIKGNLNNRLNKTINLKEFFGFDNFDRLVNWDQSGNTLLKLEFNTGFGGFEVSNGDECIISNDSQKLKIAAVGPNSGPERLLFEYFNKQDFRVSLKLNVILNNAPNIKIKFFQTGDAGEHEYVQDLAGWGNNSLDFIISKDYFISEYPLYMKIFVDAEGSTNYNPTATFTIDDFQVQEIIQNTQSYDNRGRIETNSVGDYNYTNSATNGMYRKTSINLNDESTAYYTAKPLQTLTYTMFKSPITINDSNLGATRFSYNSHLSRTKMQFGWGPDNIAASNVRVTALIAQPSNTYTKTKWYTDDGSTEIIKADGKIRIITYIGGDAYSAPLYNEKVKTNSGGAITDNNYYLHRDYLGSIIAISNQAGVAIERRHFDAWGNLAKLEKNGFAIAMPSANGGLEALMVLDRGYTSHEHLAEVGLIQMNGRLYDPKLHTFLMPDNFVQQPENTQNYNRFAYVLNNPLRYTDPSGEFIPFLVAVAIGAAISAATYYVTCLTTGQNFSFGGLAQATFIGAASAAVTFGIGSASSAMFSNFYSQAAFQAIAHGAFQGGMTAINGGNFWNGFAAGALSSIAASSFKVDLNGSKNAGLGWANNFRQSGAGMIAFGTVTGGVGAKLSGGNFWEGAAIGLIVSGLNHAMHQMSKPKTTVAGIYGAGGEEASGNPDLRRLVERKGGRMFTSTVGGGDDEIIAYLKAGFDKGNQLEIYGHSRGGAAAVRIANTLGGMHINIAQITLYDPVALFGGGSFNFDYPNVMKVNNYYQRNPTDHLMSGYEGNMANNPFQGSPVSGSFQWPAINNVNYTGNLSINHINITDYAIRHP